MNNSSCLREREKGEGGVWCFFMAIFPGCSLCTPCVLSKATSLAEVIAEGLYMIIHVLYMYMYMCIHILCLGIVYM